MGNIKTFIKRAWRIVTLPLALLAIAVSKLEYDS